MVTQKIENSLLKYFTCWTFPKDSWLVCRADDSLRNSQKFLMPIHVLLLPSMPHLHCNSNIERDLFTSNSYIHSSATS